MKTRLWVPAILLLLAASAAAQQPRIVNAKLETRSAAAGLERGFHSLVAAQAGPAWIGYAVPIVAGQWHACCSMRCGSGCLLEERNATQYQTDARSVQLEGAQRLVVLYRVEQRAVRKIRWFTEDCELDAGGLPFYWLTDVRAAESVALLGSFVGRFAEGSKDGRRLAESALAVVAQQADASADQALEGWVAPDQPEEQRKKAVFWLGSSRGRRGYEILDRLAREDPSEKVREQVVFALYVSKEPQAVEAIIRTARQDASPRVRGQALFWLAQRAGRQAAEAITAAIENDPETEVKKKAVFALSQLPKDEGVPLLIQVARTNKNPVVRKQAMFWLGQSNDARALAFFEEILKR